MESETRSSGYVIVWGRLILQREEFFRKLVSAPHVAGIRKEIDRRQKFER